MSRRKYTPCRRDEGRRVLVVVRWPVGGIRTYLLYNYPELAAAGYRFTFVGPDDASFRVLREELADWEGAEFVPAPVRGRRCALWRPCRRLLRTGRFALIHSHGVIAGAQAAVANVGAGVPHVMTAHDVFRPVHAAGLAGRARLWLLGRLLRGVDTLVAVGGDVRANFLEYLPTLATSRCRLVCIPNGIDAGRFAEPHGDADDLRARLGVGGDVPLFGFLGRFMEQKGFLPLLDALSLLVAETTAPFHLLAMGSGDYEREYRREAERRGLANRISFVPFVPDVAPVLRQLDLLLVPSLWEAYPLLAMEAMAAGTPVLGSDCIGLREVLRDTPSLVARADDAEDWCRALRETLAAPRHEEARAFAEEARARFDVAPAARRLREVCDESLVGRVKRAGAPSGLPFRARVSCPE